MNRGIFTNHGEYKDKNGDTKISWKRVGDIFVSKEGKEYVKLYNIPGHLCHIFEDKQRDDRASYVEPQVQF